MMSMRLFPLTAPSVKLIFWSMICLCLFSAQVFAKDKRVALVIGNSAYQHVSNLPNPANDAEDISNSLKRIGFDVTTGLNLDYKGMRLMLRDFTEAAVGADVALIYFAGHGIEIENTNYLIPVNATLRSDRDVEFEAVRLDAIVNSISDTSGLKLVIIDACRNNPFVAQMSRASATRSIGRGLARIDPGGVVVGYAARGGTLALDGDGRNSPYAKALLQHLEQPGLELGKMFRKVRDSVYEMTDGFQEPFTYGSLPGEDIFLVPAALPNAQAQGSSPGENTERRDAAIKLLEEALSIEDDTAKTSVLDMLARLYPETEAGRTARALLKPQGQGSEQAAETTPNEPVTVEDPSRQETKRARQTPSDIEAALNLGRQDYQSLQRALNALGFDVGVEDGIFGRRSRSALERYQSQLGLPDSGYLTAGLVSTLKAVPIPRSATPIPVAPAPTARFSRVVDNLIGKRLIASNGTVFEFHANGTIGGTFRGQSVKGTYTSNSKEVCSKYSSPSLLRGRVYCSVPQYSGNKVIFKRRDGTQSERYRIEG